ncbi:MAG: hypothetical protein AB8B99_08485 [Phormidesmis sp.]
MGRNQLLKKLRRLSVVMLGAYVVTGCPSPTVGKLVANSNGTRQAVAQETIQTTVAQSAAVSYDVCADVENWQRPSEAVQAKRLGEDARYGEALQTGALKKASTQFWDHSVVSFTTYGLSARMEPENLSGVWTASDEMTGCYTPEDTVAINEGDRAETWLLNQRISHLEWKGDRYVMTVEPAPSGLQVIQFDRTDELASLPLDVVNTSGETVGVMSGDWQ